MKVLIIDDHEPSLQGLSQYIKASWKIEDVGLEIVGVRTLADGLREASSANVTILDLSLPDSELPETIKAIRKFRPPVIVLTGTDDPDIAAACMTNGADHVCVKGSAFGLLSLVFESMQKDVIRRAADRKNGQ